ncbi:hypothetical protein [Tropicimonas marinistellae]|uniref:hypothetical protein n=1 Tax=Tropicimonas marinistellae TaxID=1739787 RepID=UPI00082B48EC|nr:hypothetical protein [Tropicimonas marinistellae]
MVLKLSAMFGLLRSSRPEAPARDGAASVSPAFATRLAQLDRDPYLSVADPDLRLISVFDDLTYDRADLDMLTGPMRRHAVAKLAQLGFRQVSGSVIDNRADDVRVLIPKIHALGASPFDAARYLVRRPQDYVLLTPTQVACQMIDTYPCEEAVDRIKVLIGKHPINLFKIMDHLEPKEAHRTFRDAIGHLKFVQRKAIEAEPLRRRRALR